MSNATFLLTALHISCEKCEIKTHLFACDSGAPRGGGDKVKCCSAVACCYFKTVLTEFPPTSY